MCLTICRKRELIYDNDRIFDCQVCPFLKREDNSQKCVNCEHYRKDDDNNPYCVLTSMPTPNSQWCCHWNAPLTLPYYPRSLQNVDGIVLVTSEQFIEAIEDYHNSYDNSEPVETNISVDDWFDDEDELIELSTETPDLSESDDLTAFVLEKLEAKANYQLVSPMDLTEKIYVPVMVGDDLVRENGGIDGVIAWFEAIFGGKEDILRDWKGRWIVKPVRFAVPAVYGLVSEDWSGAIGEDVSDLIHDFFS